MPDKTDNLSPLRVLHLTAGSDAGGLSRYIFDLCTAMHSGGHQVAVAGERGAWHWLFESAPFPWIDAPMKGGPFALRIAAKTLNKWIDQHQIDLLHVHYRRCALVGRSLQKKHGVPMLYTLHLSDIRVSWPWSYFSDFGDHTHVASMEARAWLVDEAKVPPPLVSVIPHGIDFQRFPVANDIERASARSALGLSATDRVAAYVGRLDSPKNEEWMLDVAQQSRDRIPNLKVILVGEGPHEAMLRKRVTDMQLENRVMLLGHRDPMPIYHAADALLLPSQREGFSLVCAEAMSTGIPVLRTKTAGTDALVVENATGRSAPIDHDAFVAAAIDFLADESSLLRMGKLAAGHIRSHFGFAQQLRDTIDLYRSLMAMQQNKKREGNRED